MESFRPKWLPINWFLGSVVLPLTKWENEQFLPFRPNQLIEFLKARAPEDFDWHSFTSSLGPIKQSIRIDFQRLRGYGAELYAAFDPDRDLDDRALDHIAQIKQKCSVIPDRLPVDESACRELFEYLGQSMQRANYRRLSPREILAASKAVSKWGVRLKIRFSSFRRLEVYGRGDIMTRRTVRDWKRLFRKSEIDVPIYQRIAVVFRAKELQQFAEPYHPDRVHIRLFKNVPKVDVDMMLPGGKIRLNWIDTGKIGIPTLWGIIMMASKLAKSFWVIALIGALKLVSWALLLIAFAIATCFYGIKSVLSYGTTKRRYQLNVAQSLYFQNLDTNLGALLRLEEEGEQQRICEAILAYFIIEVTGKAMTSEEIDRRAEDILKEITGFRIDFDVTDSLRFLASLKILDCDGSQWSLAKVKRE